MQAMPFACGKTSGKGLVKTAQEISKAAKQHQWQHAVALLAEMPGQKLQPDVITCNAAISACGKGSQWQQALELLAEMQAEGLEPSVITYSAAISACEKGVRMAAGTLVSGRDAG